MPMSIELDKINKENIKIQSSKVAELLSLVHFYMDSKHSENKKEFYNYLHNNLTEDCKKTIEFIFNLPYHGLQILLFLLSCDNLDDIPRFIDYVKKTDNEYFCYVLSGELIRKREDINGIADRYIFLKPKNENALIKLASDTETAKIRFIAMLTELNMPNFHKIIDEYQKEYDKSVSSLKLLLENHSPAEIIAKIKNTSFDEKYTFKQYIFIPGMIMKPHRTYYFYNNDTFLLLYDDDRVNSLAKVDDELIEFMKALSDKSRFQILKELILETNNCKNLSAKMNLTTATVSRHLDSLRNIGVIYEERLGKNKYYKVDYKQIKKIIDDLEFELIKIE